MQGLTCKFFSSFIILLELNVVFLSFICCLYYLLWLLMMILKQYSYFVILLIALQNNVINHCAFPQYEVCSQFVYVRIWTKLIHFNECEILDYLMWLVVSAQAAYLLEAYGVWSFNVIRITSCLAWFKVFLQKMFSLVTSFTVWMLIIFLHQMGKIDLHWCAWVILLCNY